MTTHTPNSTTPKTPEPVYWSGLAKPKISSALERLNYKWNPSCPMCWCNAILRKGLTRSGDQRYVCKSCRKSFQENVVYRRNIDKARVAYVAYFYGMVHKNFLVKYLWISMSQLNNLINQYRDYLILNDKSYFKNDWTLISAKTGKPLPCPWMSKYFDEIAVVELIDEASGFLDKYPVHIFDERKPWIQSDPRPLYKPKSRREAIEQAHATDRSPETEQALEELNALPKSFNKIMDYRINKEQVEKIQAWEGRPELEFYDGRYV